MDIANDSLPRVTKSNAAVSNIFVTRKKRQFFHLNKRRDKFQENFSISFLIPSFVCEVLLTGRNNNYCSYIRESPGCSNCPLTGLERFLIKNSWINHKL